jgi:hypothetical protein
MEHNLDGFVVEGRAYLLKGSDRYRTYLKRPIPLAISIMGKKNLTRPEIRSVA